MADFYFENSVKMQFNTKYICGIDEAGRGPWAGPVVAAAVILDFDNSPIGLDDSKKLSEKRRELLATEIKAKAIAFSICYIDARIIDEINILQATLKAMEGAINGLNTQPDYALIDGNRSPKININHQTIIKGDSKSASIAAASILAKTARDEYMKKMHIEYPQYDFENNMGYGVPKHIEALNKFGPCPIHRMSFKPLKNLPTNIK